MANEGDRGDGSAQAGQGPSPGSVLENYLSELANIRGVGAAVDETSFYPAISDLFNAVGKTLKPKVRCNLHPGNRGARIPDGGLYTADQFRRQAAGEPKPGQLPSRGAVEVKPTRQIG